MQRLRRKILLAGISALLTAFTGCAAHRSTDVYHLSEINSQYFLLSPDAAIRRESIRRFAFLVLARTTTPTALLWRIAQSKGLGSLSTKVQKITPGQQRHPLRRHGNGAVARSTWRTSGGALKQLLTVCSRGGAFHRRMSIFL